MGKVRKPLPVKLVVAMLSGDPQLFDQAEARLVEIYGPRDYASVTLPFAHTDYYESEFGPDLLRKFVAFRNLVDPGELAQIKVQTNQVEQELAVAGKRRINLDPGYISMAKFVLATTKNHGHRIYIGQGIYAEVTLRYHKKAFCPWEWTYPDYRQEKYFRILEEVRSLYVQQTRTLRQGGPPSDQ